IEDSDHDGLAFWYSAQVEGETSGQMRLRKVGGSYIEFFPGDFGRYHRYDFTVGFTLDVAEVQNEPSIAIFPNPGSGQTTVELSGQVNGRANLQLLDLTGRSLHQEQMNASANFAESFIDISPFPSGTYLIQIETAQGKYTQKYIRQ
ncbi:MAG: T9SS type A sorting domain-containing protein, partial [Sphingomonadales bacterium]